jgi:hypothetical protein
MFCVADCVAGRVGLAIPEPPEWQHIGNQIDAAFIFARADFVNVRNQTIQERLASF